MKTSGNHGIVLAMLMVLEFGSAAAIGAQPPSLPWVSARGRQLVDEAGHPVVLRGVNLGGWLVEEMWMMPFTTDPPDNSTFSKIVDHHTLWSTIQSRFDPVGMIRVRTALREAWLDEGDFARIHADGFNSVRLPFLYDLLDEPGGWNWLDHAVDWAGNHQIYLVLDLHGAPGGQSKEHTTGWINTNRLFFDDKYVAQTEEIWRRVARRYRDRPQVAAFDLLNEPMGAPDRDMLYRVQDRLYLAVRSVDNRHVIAIEDAYTGLDHMPLPADRGWRNVMASCHHYQFHAQSEQDQIDAGYGHLDYMKRSQDRLGVPMYLGEFNQEPWGSPRSLSMLIHGSETQGYSWALWTYKFVGARRSRSMWGVYSNRRAIDPIDPFRDSEHQMLEKFQQLRTERLTAYPGMLRTIMQ